MWQSAVYWMLGLWVALWLFPMPTVAQGPPRVEVGPDDMSPTPRRKPTPPREGPRETPPPTPEPRVEPQETSTPTHSKSPVETNVVSLLEDTSREYCDAMIRGDRVRLMSLYDFPMGWYFSKKDATRFTVEDDVEKYFKKWRYRSARLLSLNHLGQDDSTGGHLVRLVYEYSFVTKSGQPKQGVSVTTLLWANVNGQWKITSTFETVDRHVR